MNNLQTIAHLTSEMTLEELLQALTKYGNPQLIRVGNGGWYCSIEMHVTSAGVDFKVASNFDLPTPTAAATQCLARTEKAVSLL